MRASTRWTPRSTSGQDKFGARSTAKGAAGRSVLLLLDEARLTA
jgi:hypothetical protein